MNNLVEEQMKNVKLEQENKELKRRNRQLRSELTETREKNQKAMNTICSIILQEGGEYGLEHRAIKEFSNSRYRLERKQHMDAINYKLKKEDTNYG